MRGNKPNKNEILKNASDQRSETSQIKSLKEKQKDHLEKVIEIEEKLEKIQRSTKTSVTFFSPIHEKLRSNLKWYYNWHLYKHASLVHLVVLLFYLFAVSIAVYGFFNVGWKLAEKTIPEENSFAIKDTSLVKKDTSGDYKEKDGEKEIISERTRNFKKFKKKEVGKTVYRVSGQISDIHYKDDPNNENEQYKEIDLTLLENEEKNRSKDFDYYLDKNGYKIKIWNETKPANKYVYYLAQFERLGQNIKMAPLALAWENNLGEYQEISKVAGGIEPLVDNEHYKIIWKNAFGKDIDFAYNLSPDKFYKTVIINNRECLNPPQISGDGLKLSIIMSIAWSDVETKNGFAKNKKNGLIASDYINGDEKSEIVFNQEEFSYKNNNRDLWWMQKPYGWDSSGDSRNIEMSWEMETTKMGVFMKLNTDYSEVFSANIVYPVYLDTAISEEYCPASEDDAVSGGDVYPGDDDVFLSNRYFSYLGKVSTNYYMQGYRFDTVPIPNSATIDSASLSLYSYSNLGGSPTFVIAGYDADDPPSFTSDNSPYDQYLAKTDVAIDWDAPFVVGTREVSPDISSIIGEITSRAGWSQNNAVSLLVYPDTDISTQRRISFVDLDIYLGVTNYGPRFNATYSETISISGNCKQYDQSSSCADSETVKVAYNGSIQTETGTTSSGTYEISDLEMPSSGDVITVFIDGVDDDKEAVSITKYDGYGGVENLDLYERHLTIGSDDNQTISNSDLSSYDNSVSSDEDIFIEVDANNDLTVPASSTSTYADQEIIIKASNTYRPDSSSSGNATVPNIEIPSSAIFTADGNTIELTDDGTPFAVSGTFNYDTSTLKYTAAGDTNITATTYYNLETKPSASPSGWAVSGAGDATYDGIYTESGTHNTKPSYTNGTKWLYWYYSSLISHYNWALNNSVSDGLTPDSAMYYDYNSTDLPGDNWVFSYNSPAPSVSAASYTYTFASGTLIANNNYINGDGTNGVITDADTNDPDIAIGGSFTNSDEATFTASSSADFSVASNFSNSSSATFTHSSGTITFNGSSTQEIDMDGDILNNLILNGSGAVFRPVSALNIDGTFTLTNGTLNLDTNDPIVNIAGDITINGGSVTKSSSDALVTFNGDLTYTDNVGGINFGDVQIGASPDTTNLSSDYTCDSLTIASGDYFYTNGYEIDCAGDITINSTGTLDATDDGETDGTIINIGGSWSNSGTFTADTSEVIFDATSSGKTLSGTLTSASAFNDLTFNGSGGEWALGANLEVAGALTLDDGTFSTSGSDYSITVGSSSAQGGSYEQNGGTFNANGSTITSYGPYHILGGTYTYGTSDLILDATPGGVNLQSDSYTLNNVLFKNNSATNARVITIGSATSQTLTFAGNFYIEAASSYNMTVTATTYDPDVNVGGNLDFTGSGGGSESLSMGDGDWTVTGNCDVQNGSITANNSNLILNGNGSTWASYGHQFYDVEIANNITLTNTPFVTHQLTVNSTKTLTVSSSKRLEMRNNSSLIINGEISGAGYVWMNPGATINDGGTLNLNVLYYVTYGNTNISARTYSDEVEISNTGGAARTVTLGTASSQTITFESNLYLKVDGSQNMTVVGTTYNPDVNISGNLDYAGTGGGTEILNAGSGTWTVDGNINFASGTFAHNNGTFVLDGTSNQTVTSASQAFYDLEVINASSDPGVTFADALDVDNLLTDTTASSTLTFTAATTSTINDINLDGQDTGTRIVIQSTTTSAANWNVAASTQTSVSNVSVSYNDASSGSEIKAGDGTNYDGGNNTNWDFIGNESPQNNSLTFTNPYASNIAVSDNTTEWNFRALVTDEDGSSDLDYVELRFANSSDSTSPYDSLKYRWTESSDTFSEVADTQSTASIVSSSSDSNADGNQWTLDFKIKFDSPFSSKDTGYNVGLYSLDKSSDSDSDDYSNVYQVTGLSISINLDSPTISFGNLLPGTILTDTTVATVSANYANGYSLSVHDSVSSDDSVLLHTDTVSRIVDYNGTISTPTLWSGVGLGICLYSATDKEAKWGTGVNENDSNNKYAGVPESSTIIHEKTGSPTSNDENYIGYKLVVPNTQKTGDYSGTLTFTVTGVLN